MKIMYLHGARATEKSFAFFQQALEYENHGYINYSSDFAAKDNLKTMVSVINSIDEDVFLVGHSLGGIYSLHLLEHCRKKIKGAVSLATPFNGSEIAVVGRMFQPRYQLFKDIMPNSEFIHKTKNIVVDIPWTQIVSTKSRIPWVFTNNDGIVTFRSMRDRTDVEYVDVPYDHYEILCSQEAVDIVRDRINQV